MKMEETGPRLEFHYIERSVGDAHTNMIIQSFVGSL